MRWSEPRRVAPGQKEGENMRISLLSAGTGLLMLGASLSLYAQTQRTTNEPSQAAVSSKDAERLKKATEVFQEIMSTPDKGIPRDLLEKAQCAVIVPGVKKGAFIIGGEFGKGFVTCRSSSGSGWTAPGAIRVEGGSFGFQIGGEETDAVMLVMNKSGEDKIMSSQFKLGADASVAAGPVGRSAAADTDAYMTAEILTWSRSRGVFAGISLSGATVRQDFGANKGLYGHEMTNKEIVEGQVAVPAAARPLISELDRYSPAHNEMVPARPMPNQTPR
jgi:SH3 domain-containing YSC84-like protein 1